MKKIIFLISLFALLSFSFGLKITEVYFDGRNEFVGIYNDKDSSFSGTIIISGAKASNVILDVKINKNEEIILGDNIDSMLSGVNAYKTGLSLSLSDSKEINIQLLDVSGQVLDTFFIDKDNVKSLDNKKTSFEKILSGENWIVQATQIPKNNATDFLINPGFVFTHIDTIDNSEKNNNTGDLDTTNETNNSNSNSDSQASSNDPTNSHDSANTNNNGEIDDSNQDLDNQDNMSNTNNTTSNSNNSSTDSNSDSSDTNLDNQDNKIDNIVQTKKCSIILNKHNDKYIFSYSGDFTADYIKWWVNGQEKGKMSNLSLVVTTGNYEILAQGYQNTDYCEAKYNLFIEKTETIKEIEVIKTKEIIKNICTGEYDGKLIFTEIHPKKDSFDEYVELQAINGNISGTYEFIGLGRGNTTYTQYVNLYSGDFLVISKSLSGFKYKNNIKIFSSLSLSDAGENLEVRQYGQDIDKIYFKGNNSLYLSYKSGDTKYFTKEDKSSPGYSEKINKYFIDNCNINLKKYSFTANGIKITLSPHSKYCGENNISKWTYKDSVYTNNCKEQEFLVKTGENTIYLEIQDNKQNSICKGNFHILNIIKNNESINCNIKIQSPKTYFYSKDKLNLISIINGKEIQNSNTTYKCKYILSGQVLSNLCNPSSVNIPAGLYNLQLLVYKDNVQVCQTSQVLNIPVYHSSSKKTCPVNPISCSKLSSTKLIELNKLVRNKYKLNSTLRKIYKPISYLFTTNKASIDSCLNLNSTELKELISKIPSKYKSNYTIRKIFSSIDKSYLIDKNLKLPKIHKILANPIGKDINKEVLILTGQSMSGLSITTSSKTVVLTGNSTIFTGNFGFNNKKDCLFLKLYGNTIDYKCYSNPEEGKYISNFTDNILDNIKIEFSGENIILQFKNYEKIYPNESLIKFKKKLTKKLKKVLGKLLKEKRQLIKENKKLHKKYNKLLNKSEKIYLAYIRYYKKYQKTKNDCKIKSKKKSNSIKKKNTLIKQLKNQVSFLRSFTIHMKQFIDKKEYKKFLDNYRKVKKGEKIRY